MTLGRMRAQVSKIKKKKIKRRAPRLPPLGNYSSLFSWPGPELEAANSPTDPDGNSHSSVTLTARDILEDTEKGLVKATLTNSRTYGHEKAKAPMLHWPPYEPSINDLSRSVGQAQSLHLASLLKGLRDLKYVIQYAFCLNRGHWTLLI